MNIRFFCYAAEEEMAVRHFVDQIKKDRTLACRLVEHNLYKIFLSICDDKRITKSIPHMEERKGKDFLIAQMHTIATAEAFAARMQYQQQPGDVLMLTGVGEVFPFMRIHSLLEALQPHFSDIPILVMYPGVFNGRHVKLFDRLRPNDYYRAFNVV